MTTALTIDNPLYFDRLAEIEAEHWWALGMWRLASFWLDAAVRGRRGLAALDVGCGTGMTMLRLGRRREIDSVVGLDPSPDALAHATRRHRFPVVRGSALDLPFEAARFDVITCFDVLQHLPPGDDRRAVSEFARVLRPGGLALIRSNARGRSPAAPGQGPCYRLDELVGVFEGAGLSVRRASYVNCVPALAQEVRGRLARSDLNRESSHPAGGGLRIRLLHPWVNGLMGLVSTGEAVVAGRLGVPLPFGHSTMILTNKHEGTAVSTTEFRAAAILGPTRS